MIDIHSHPLPGLDDGAADWDAALAMARLWAADGVRQVVATPHWTGTDPGSTTLLSRLDEFRARVGDAGLDLRLHAGNEVVLTPMLADALQSGSALTLAGGSYLLLETAQLPHGAYIHNAIFHLQSQGYRIVLAHPERVPAWQADPKSVTELLWKGCRLQVNAGSLLGEFGAKARKAAEKFLQLGWVSVVASDAHSPDARRPQMLEARVKLERLLGATAAADLTDGNPARVLCNEHLPEVQIESETPGFLHRLFHRS